MKQLKTSTDGGCVLNEDVEVHAMIAGTLTVERGAHVRPFSTVVGDVICKQRATIDISSTATIAGSVYVRGYARIHGRINGAVKAGRNARVEIGSGAIVRGGQHPLIELPFVDRSCWASPSPRRPS